MVYDRYVYVFRGIGRYRATMLDRHMVEGKGVCKVVKGEWVGVNVWDEMWRESMVSVSDCLEVPHEADIPFRMESEFTVNPV